ncbi:nuclear transport factor 2 family protein [Novosphingobium sp. BL-8H]|uniref:nuclear transport factor 2 family protein n=1 Tax=Novosphingobium sp. BL-8H TaxID=3127640 RepID=UPI003757C831
MILFALLAAAASSSGPTSAPASADPLTAEIAAIDDKVFTAYNACDLDTFARYFDPDVAFFHDTGGATFDRKTVVDNTRKYICGKVRRELLPASLHVYPIKDYGAIEEGEHYFCDRASGQCEGIAKFVIVWARRQDGWHATQVLSYGHRTMTEAEQRAIPQAER